MSYHDFQEGQENDGKECVFYIMTWVILEAADNYFIVAKSQILVGVFLLKNQNEAVCPMCNIRLLPSFLSHPTIFIRKYRQWQLGQDLWELVAATISGQVLSYDFRLEVWV